MSEETKKSGIPPEESPEDISKETAAAESEEIEVEASEDAVTTQNGSNGDEEAESATSETAESEETAEGDDAKKEAPDSKKKKNEKKDPKDEKIAELSDRVLRQQAEFINYRNRTDKEKAAMFEVGAKSAFEKILPVIDNFERGLATLSEEEREQPFASGIDKTYRQLMTALAEAGVTPIEAVGQPFDPDLHNAVMHIEDESVGEGIVVEEFQKGYRYHDSVLRHSMVKVAN